MQYVTKVIHIDEDGIIVNPSQLQTEKYTIVKTIKEKTTYENNKTTINYTKIIRFNKNQQLRLF